MLTDIPEDNGDLASPSRELLIIIAGLIGQADAACLHMMNKNIHLITRRRLDFPKDLVEIETRGEPRASSEDLLEVRRERGSLMQRLRAKYPEETFGLCGIYLKYRRYDDDWGKKRIGVLSRAEIIEVCSAAKPSPNSNALAGTLR